MLDFGVTMRRNMFAMTAILTQTSKYIFASFAYKFIDTFRTLAVRRELIVSSKDFLNVI